ncbi:MAG: 30S ribosomal protein S4 [bacterium]
MGRHTEAKCKLCRREGEKLFLKGQKCTTEKCPFTRRSYAPGQHGKLPVRTSEYGIRLREKQKARRIYGLTEGQFEKYYDEADSRKGATGEKLMEFLERRLDNVVFRAGLAPSRQAARQFIRHGGVKLNNKKTDIPSCRVEVGDMINVTDKMLPYVKRSREMFPEHMPPVWIEVTGEAEAKVVAIPQRENIDTVLEDHLIVEYYSR